MTVVGTIYSYPQNPRVFKSLIVAKYNGLDVKVDNSFVMGTTNKTPEWIAKFGASQVPAFEGTDGTVIIESGAIAYYLAYYKESSPLIGRSNAENAHIQQWIQFVDLSIAPSLGQWIFPLIAPERAPYNKATETQAIEKVKNQLQILERHLVKKTYLVGERVTFADIASATSLYNGFKLVFDAPFRQLYPAITRWFTTIVNQPNFKDVAGEFKLCETPLKFTPPKKEAKEKKPKEEKPKAEKKPKEPEEEPEESYQDAPKPKSKLDLLPAAKMPLDEWKRQYSNNDTPVATKWLWENIDLTTDYSIWKVDYKYNNELTKLYMSNNLAGGLMNRLERARKYAFGCLVVAGEDNDNIITGYFIVRGNADEMIEEITDAADYDSYTWVKVKVDDEEKKKIDQIFAWEGQVNGKPIKDGKVFK
ncbi:Elongation factor 1-gamma [Entomortierella chlamydospora]|uniref:Elongation factor 1-gamma n=1 Tax=Entomortierella chlamydospora TaxID=101097 RepID=A0A9P6T0C0_9FUNG|nr:Elongation factor 1-gamma [Entomortierella chlamydospora]KAG0015734.1 Elongation factor 1-gamma [Entomortierella chlamydospora]